MEIKLDKHQINPTFCPIKKVNDNLLPLSIGCGAFVTFKGQKLILTVNHVIDNPGRTMLEIEVNPTRGTKTQLLENPIRQVTPVGFQDQYIDFAFYKDFPSNLQPIYQEIEKVGADYRIVFSTPRNIYPLDLDIRPTQGEICRFAGLTRPKLKDPSPGVFQQELWQHLTKEWNAVYAEVNPDIPWYYIFGLPTPQPIKNYPGTSGSPIFNSRGQIISLVRGPLIRNGEDVPGFCNGLNLAYFKPLFAQHFSDA